MTKYYEATDLSGVQITVDHAHIDLAILGEYEIAVTATDHYGNKITEKAKIIIVDANQIEEVTATKDGEKPQSQATKKQKTQQTTHPQNTNNSNTKNPESTSTTSPIYRTDISNRYVNEINVYRIQNGEPALSVSTETQAEANRRAMELISYYSHDGCGDGFTENIGWKQQVLISFKHGKIAPVIIVLCYRVSLVQSIQL